MHLLMVSVRKSVENLQHRWQVWTWSASGSWWDSQMGRCLHHGIEGVLGLLLILLLASFWTQRPRSTPHVVASAASQDAVALSRDITNTIVSAHLFGQAASRTLAAAASLTAITVDGVAYASQPTDSEAVLTLNGKTDVYKVGAVLADGEKIAAIDAYEVQLAANGTIRRLALAHYSTPDSEGPTAYAALLHGNVSNGPLVEQPHAMLQGMPTSSLAEPVMPLSYISATNFAPTSSISVVQIPATATPLEQLRTLRQQLVHRQ